VTEAPGFLLYIVAFLLLLGPLVFVHEFGHYIAGRWFGVKADEFSIGFGHEVAGFTDKRGTRWKFGWLPLGGYVKFAGDMNPASVPTTEWLQLPASERAKTFQAKPLWQRAIIVAAGPFVNLALAVLILSGFALAFGQSTTPPVIGEVVAGSAAAKAGLRTGDRIVEIGGSDVTRFDDLRIYAAMRPNETVAVGIVRDGRPATLPLTIGTLTEKDRFGNAFSVGRIGIGPSAPVWSSVGVLEAPVVGVRRTGEIIGTMVDTIGQIVSGRRSVKEMGAGLAGVCLPAGAHLD
jgi:regulator of sigma E protease